MATKMINKILQNKGRYDIKVTYQAFFKFELKLNIRYYQKRNEIPLNNR